MTASWGGAGSPEATQLAARYLARSRRYRAVGFAIGWSLPFWVMVLRGTAYPSESVLARGLAPALGLAVFTGAIVLHEMTFRPKVVVPTASLEPRGVRRYLPTWMLVAPAAVAVMAFVLAIVAVVIADRGDVTFDRALTQIVSAVAMAVVVGIGYLALSAIAQRRQSLDTASELSVDDMSRSFGSEVVWRASMSVSLVTLASIGWTLDFVRSSGGGTWLPNWVMFAFVGCALAGYALALAAAMPNPTKFKLRADSEAMA